MPDFELAIVGGGLASARAIKAYREEGGEGRIALFSRDRFLPYHRPPLSKRYLRGEQERDAVFVEQESFYRESGVEVLLETGVDRVHPGERALELEDGRRYGYRRLLVATGARPRRLRVPGEGLDAIFTLRSLDDSTAIGEAARAGARAVVVGAGFIGMEVTASLRHLGVEVSMIHMGDGLFDQLGCEELSRALGDLYREHGVELVLGDAVAAYRGRERFEGLETQGGRTLAGEFAVVGVGVAPAVELLEGSGVELDDGVVVNEGFRAGAPDVYAVGDVARFRDPLFQRRRRIEHWSNASYQGTQVGKALAGGDARYEIVSTFFTEVFGVTIKVFGDIAVSDELVVRGSFADRDAIAFYLQRGRLVGTLLVGQDEETEQRLKDAIAAGGPVPEDGAR